MPKARRDLEIPGYVVETKIDPDMVEKVFAKNTHESFMHDARHMLVQMVMGLRPDFLFHLKRALQVMTEAGCSDEDKIDVLTRGVQARKTIDVANIVSIAWTKAAPLKRKRIESEAISPTRTQALIVEICDELREMLLAKNRKYGDSALNPKRIFSKASPIEQIYVRIDDKLSRVESGQVDEDEDVVRDLIGYLVLLMVARRNGAEVQRG